MMARVVRTTRGGRRGAAYLLVLAVTVLITATGIGTLLVQRIRTRTAVWSADGQRAAALAASAVEMAAYQLANRASWRTGYASGTWAGGVTIGEGSLSFKLVDEVDGNLSDDPGQPVRVYGRAQVGSAVRVFSVVAEPRTVTTSPNLVLNPGIEDGVNGWYAWGTCSVAAATGAYAGTQCLAFSGRSRTTDGPAQNVTGMIAKGTMSVSVWGKRTSNAGNETLRVMLDLETTAGSTSIVLASGAMTNSWQKVSGTTAVTWTGRLNNAVLRVQTTDRTESMRIDEMTVQPFGASTTSTTVMTFDPTTWRRESDD